MFNLTSSTPKTWQTVSRQADRVNGEQTVHTQTTNNAQAVRDLGGILRERREAMGASLAEVETATRIRQKYLAAFESDDWHLLPGEIVGRGFLRNYATYLGLDSTELVERRRAIADGKMNSSLAGTSAGSALPPERDVDYRPKDVALKDEQEAIQQRELSLGPLVRVAGILGVLLFAWWLVSSYGPQLASSFTSTMSSVQTRVSPEEAASVATAAIGSSAIVAEPELPVASLSNVVATPAVADSSSNQAVNPPTDNGSPSTNGAVGGGLPAVAEVAPTATPTQEEVRTLILIPTSTPLPVEAVDTSGSNEVVAETVPVEEAPGIEAPVVETPVVVPTDPPTATPLPTEAPTEIPPTATPAPPAIVAPACPDQRSVLSSPGVNQTISGVIPITGRATHEALQYYKLEYAFGANATDGFVYFDGANSAVDGGTLGTFNSASLPNGAYTLQLTVVDLSANYPPPCQVTITIQN